MPFIVKVALPVLVAGAAIWGYMQYTQQVTTPYGAVPQQQDNTAQQAPTPVAVEAGADITARDTSNTSLDADLQAIDAQLQAAVAGQAAIDAGLNDTAGNTTY
ncbi:MAG: hypothetical protein RLZZ342_760 [Candidatus Parcubacteria bacterium]|jgi:hypothetical protein